MKILLVYPETPSTFWSFSNALKFISKKASEIPLGLITAAAMLPESWELKLVDTNVHALKDRHIQWADYVFISAMDIQAASFRQIVKRCNELDRKVVAGGPMVTFSHREFLGVDHFILGEAETILPQFVRDVAAGCAAPEYRADGFPDLSLTPIPRWDLLNMKHYASMDVQYSRGCPFDCDFCSITLLNGRKPRAKSTQQFLAELNALFNGGWRGPVFIVDDNFIGNRKQLKEELLPALVEWSQTRGTPFSFTTETSINLADDDELIRLMVDAGFRTTFIGIETPNSESLAECGKRQNQSRDLVASVKKIQRAGLSVSAGFILGFDHDPPTIFQQQIGFIQKSGIVTAMVGLLNAPRGTRLFQRLKKEDRLIHSISGNNMDGTINFIPKMNYQQLIRGYKQVLLALYSPKPYFLRVKTFLKEYDISRLTPPRIGFTEIRAMFRSVWRLGLQEKGKRYYWRLLGHCLIHYPRKFALAVTLTIYGYHFRKIAEAI